MVLPIIALILLIAATIMLQQLIDVFEDPIIFKAVMGGFFVLYVLVAICFKVTLPPVSNEQPHVAALASGLGPQGAHLAFPDFPKLVGDLFNGSNEGF